MHAALRPRRHTMEDYFERERHSPDKHEFWYGDIVMMAGASPAHNELVAHITGLFFVALDGKPCRPVSSDQRLRATDDVATYPDVSVYCGAMDLIGERRETATNPTLLVEVLSPSTRDYDQGEKLDVYKEIASLHDVLLVEVDIPRIHHHYRTPAGWESRIADGLDATVKPVGLALELPLRRIYARRFPEG